MQCPVCFSANLKKSEDKHGYVCQKCQKSSFKKTLLKPVSICRHCQRKKKIHNQESWLCKSCQDSLNRNKKLQRKGKVICCKCGKLKSSSQTTRDICLTCAYRENNGYQQCSGCQKMKYIRNKKRNLCKFCYDNFLASTSLRKLIQNYDNPFEYNQYLFDLLSSEINWKTVDESVRKRLSDFSNFLQEQIIPNPITWQIIEDLLPEITSENIRKTKNIRQCLLGLGYVLATNGQLESHEQYRRKRRLSSYLEKSSPKYQKLLDDYVQFLQKNKRTFENIINHLTTTINFLGWCENQNINSVQTINFQVIQDYLKYLKTNFYCQKCDLDFFFDNNKQTVKCPTCKQLDSVINRNNYSTATIRKYKGKLNVFFDWLKLNRKVIINPVKGVVINHSPKIQHYPSDIIVQLWEYAQSETAEPTKALILYLIIVHAFRTTELTNAQIPQVTPINSKIQTHKLESVYSVTLPQSSVSYGRRSPGRPHETIHFSQAAKSWLKPLLSRYEDYRNSILKNSKNPYLFTTLANACHVKPVSKTYMQKQVKQVCNQILGIPCTIGLLRKTVAVMYADKMNGSILKQFGWEDQQAFFYTWGDRELINLKPVDFASEMPIQE